MMKRTAGDIIRYWRINRGLSQMALANLLEVSFRHLNYIENDKSKGSRKLLLELAKCLNLSFRACNSLLIASNFAPEQRQPQLSHIDDEQTRTIMKSVIMAFDPNPAVILDHNFNIIMCNRGMDLLIDTFARNPERLRAEKLTVARLNFHPDGLIDAIVDKKSAMGSYLGRSHVAFESAYFEHEELMQYRSMWELADDYGTELAEQDTQTPKFIIPLTYQRDDMKATVFTTMLSLDDELGMSMPGLKIDVGIPLDPQTSAFFASNVAMA